MPIDEDPSKDLEQMLRRPIFQTLLAELQAGLGLYWETAGQILTPCGVALKPPDETALSFKKNFFSMLFLYSYHRMGIRPSRRILYAATLQCLRGMVTGCDNLLDDEYKTTLETDIPATGHRFRSVVDIMVSDRVLFQILLEAARRGDIGLDRVPRASTASMQTVTRSGIEEAGEEGGVAEILPPDTVRQTAHHYKTGILFQCPWDIPRAIETIADARLAPLLEGLYQIGMGCQILDDMVDMGADVRDRKHNYMVSLVYHGGDAGARGELTRVMSAGAQATPDTLHAGLFPTAARQARQRSHRLLAKGLGLLFSGDHQEMVPLAIRFLEQRIGVGPSANGTAP